jgi:hypothetical protein
MRQVLQGSTTGFSAQEGGTVTSHRCAKSCKAARQILQLKKGALCGVKQTRQQMRQVPQGSATQATAINLLKGRA